MKDNNIKSVIFKAIEKILPDKVFDFLWSKYYIWNVKRNSTEVSINAYYVRNKNGVKKPNYCLFRFGAAIGLFAIGNKMLFYYEWAIKNNYIPLIDAEKECDFLQGNFELCNAWEFCFRQSESINEIFNKGNVLVSPVNGGEVLHSTCKLINGDASDWWIHARTEGYREYYAKLNKLSREFWTFRPEVDDKIKSVCAELFRSGMTVLGVVLREDFSLDESRMTEDMKALYKRHPKALSLEETYKYIEEYMLKWNCTHVLITTKFKNSLEYFIDKMGDKVIFIDREREVFDDKYIEKVFATQTLNVTGNWEKYKKISEQQGGTRQRREKKAIDYAVEMAAIAKCDYCMGVKCSGLIAACILNGGKFKDLYVFEDKNNIQNY